MSPFAQVIEEEARLSRRVLALIASPRVGDEELDELARDIFRYQRAACADYGAWCETLGDLTETVTGWRQTPSLPQEAWKRLSISTAAPQRIVKTFRSSGTTAAPRSVQTLPDTTLYDRALLCAFAAGMLPDRADLDFHSLLPAPQDAPDSSLVYMIARAAAEFSAAPIVYHVVDQALDVEGFVESMRAATRPVLIAGAAFSFVHLADALTARGEKSIELPHGSRIFETGGTKGRAREIDRAALIALISRLFRVPESMIVNQYGMCEISSNFYDQIRPGRPVIRAKVTPPWARVTIVDPISGCEQPAGTPGLIQIYDPANLYTCAAILTADLGRATDDGRFEVLGRAAAADLRGCSLLVEDLGA